MYVIQNVCEASVPTSHRSYFRGEKYGKMVRENLFEKVSLYNKVM